VSWERKRLTPKGEKSKRLLNRAFLGSNTTLHSNGEKTETSSHYKNEEKHGKKAPHLVTWSSRKEHGGPNKLRGTSEPENIKYSCVREKTKGKILFNRRKKQTTVIVKEKIKKKGTKFA